MINRVEFEMLCALREAPGMTQRDLAEQLGISLGYANRVHQEIEKSKLIENGVITSRGMKELEPYKVKNAVIMAAGLSTRLVPLSYEKPKGLLSVRNEVLIERLIEQLQEAGIEDIIVVVGYKKELFFYLEEKYGVKIVVNAEFASRNNNATLMRVRELLGNSFVCACDIYCKKSMFKRYVWKSYYAGEYTEGHTDEWCMTVDKTSRIVGAQVGGENAWYMANVAYFDRAFAERYMEILEAEYNDPRTAGKLWEEIYLEHVDELDMELYRLDAGEIAEFDTLESLRVFDPLFLENVDSEIVNNITTVLGCDRSEIHDVYPLKQGLTNLSCHFATNGGEYVYRHPGVGTSEMIDRVAEMQALNLAKSIGVDSTFIYGDSSRGWKLSKFITNCSELDPHDDLQLADAMAVARKLHAQDKVLDRSFDYLEEGKSYEALLLAKGPIEVQGYDELRSQAERVKELADLDKAPVCLTHNDFFNLNLLYDEAGSLSLIDWEYAGMADYASDYGTFVVTCMLDDEEAERALSHYFNREPTLEERRHNFAYVGLAGWCWYIWALQKESEGDFVGEWMHVYYRYAKRYLALALSLYEVRA